MLDQLIAILSNNKYATALSICAMLLSLISLIYNRKNVKMQQYIDTITDQRIKWIDGLRQDFSKILSHLYLTVYLKSYANSEEEYFISQFNIDHADESQIDPEDDLNYNETLEIFKNMRNIGKELACKDNVDFIRRIDLSIIKLNESDSDDLALIKVLEKAKEYIFGEYEKENIEHFIADIKKLMSKTLKNEWERVKKEVQKGGLVNGRRKNIFD